jgi:hypothetical protein
MNNLKINRISRNKLIIIDIILLIITFFIYKHIFEVETSKRIYAEESAKFVEDNENPVFQIDKIVLYNSANAIDNSDGQLQDIDISQYTDIEIFLDNKSDELGITAENTINEMYIDNIKIESNADVGEKIFNYKNPLNCGKYVELQNWQDDGILFSVLNTNEKNKNADYNDPVFYTDCSNPISLGYINKNILTGCTVNDETDGSVAFDGSILEATNVNLDDLGAKISFSIHLTNNYNEKFVCACTIDIDVNTEDKDIYTGNYIKIINPEEDEYRFIKVSNKLS